jgi:uncharacterized membrane protein YkoI
VFPVELGVLRTRGNKLAFLKLSEVVNILIQFTSNSHLHPQYSVQQPTKEKEIPKVYVKKVLLAVALAMVVLAGAGVAYAAGSGEDSSEQQATGPGIEKAKSVALEHTNGGRVTGTEVGDEEGYYEVEVIREDGSQVDVHLDRDYNVMSTPTDHEGSDSKDASNDSGA